MVSKVEVFNQVQITTKAVYIHFALGKARIYFCPNFE